MALHSKTGEISGKKLHDEVLQGDPRQVLPRKSGIGPTTFSVGVSVFFVQRLSSLSDQQPYCHGNETSHSLSEDDQIKKKLKKAVAVSA